MTITTEHLSEVVHAHYTDVNPQEDTDDQCLAFEIKVGQYFGFALLRVCGGFDFAEKQTQCVGFSLVFTDQEGYPVNLSHKKYADVCMLCVELQQHIECAIISPVRHSPSTTEIALFRNTDTSLQDVKLAQAGNLDSSLLKAILHVTNEFETLAPVLQHYSVTNEFDIGLVDHMLSDDLSEHCN